MKSAFDKIAAGLEDAIAFAEGRPSKAKLVKPVDIKAVRERLGKTQGQFSEEFKLPTAVTICVHEQCPRQCASI